ncbi:FAD-dependent oxidoreductase [Novosphingobium colocasiae]|uniref:FAD-dependent oxidoreductase n=1 Tax=Novosphingobium colocasiae TaxID=1256513 RepID=UPI0035B11072
MSSQKGSSEVFDVVVVGSGAGGLTAAVVLAGQGLSVTVIEKAERFGGTTALSGGGAWIPNNHLMAACDQTDSDEEAVTYLRQVLGNQFDEAWIRTYVASGKAMLADMEKTTEVKFYPIPLSDYCPGLDGAKFARTVIAIEYDGRKLGKLISAVRDPLPGYAAFGSFQSDPQHVGKLTSVFKTREGFAYTMKRMAGFARDVVQYGKGSHMANGNALVGRLLKSAMDRGVTLRRRAALDSLIVEDGKVTGVVAKTSDGTLRIAARKAVVLATGGFGANAEMRKLYIPQAEDHLSAQPLENVGDGIRIGQSAGAQLAAPNAANGVWAPCSARRDSKGNILSVYPHFGPDRAKPGVVIVDDSGKRFINEAAPYQDFVNLMNAREMKQAWYIGDRNTLRKYGMGIAMPAPLPYRHLVRDGYLTEAATIAELAGKIGVPAAALEETVAKFNSGAVNGQDPEFHKGEIAYDTIQGDYNHAPNPCVGPVQEGPFYAIKLQPGDCSTILGLQTSLDAEVLNAAGQPIPGLYAVGLDQNSLMKGTYPGGGSSIGPAMTFAWRAAHKIAGVPVPAGATA